MCCLFGMVDYGHRLSGKQKTRLLRQLSVQGEERGTDATGVAYNSRGRLRIYKRPLPAHRLHMTFPSSVTVIMGHTRQVTQGSAKRNCNNHPFYGRAGERFALAHNGVLHNDLSLRRQEGLPKTKIETDSYVAVQLIEQQKALDLSCLKAMAEKIEGSFAFTVLGEGDDLFLVKGTSPLCLYHYPQQGVYVYASTEGILTRAIRRAGCLAGEPERIHLECGDILQITKGGTMHSCRFDTARLCAWSQPLWDYMPYYPARHSDREDEYMEQLKFVANTFGYAPEAIDRMLSYGFTLDEVEEFLYCGEV